MRNYLLVPIALGFLTVAQANLSDYAKLHDGKIGVAVVPRSENENSKVEATGNSLQSDAEISAAFAGSGTLDTGKPCGQQRTVIVTETASLGVVKAIETGGAGDSVLKMTEPTGATENNNTANQNTEDRGTKKKKTENEDEGNGSGRGNQNSQNANGNGRDRTVEVLTITKNVNINGGNHDKTVTLVKTEIRNAVNGNEAAVTQLSFVTQTVFKSGSAPTVTVTPLAQVITQLVTVTANANAAVQKVITVTEQAPAVAAAPQTVTVIHEAPAVPAAPQTVTVIHEAPAVAAAPAATVTVTQPGICTTTTGLPVAILPGTVTQNMATASTTAIKVETAPSPVISGNANGLGTIGANGLCDCQCLCGTAAFPNLVGPQFVASPTVPAAASPQTTLKTVVSFSAQAPAATTPVATASVNTVAPAAASVAPAGAGSAVSVGASVPFTNSAPPAVQATASAQIVSAAGTAPAVKSSSVLSSSPSIDTSILVAPGTAPVAAGTTSVQATAASSSVAVQATPASSSVAVQATTPSGSAASQVSPGISLESTTSSSVMSTLTPQALIQQSSTVSLEAVITTAPVVPVPVNGPAIGGGLPASFDINTYSLASAVVLGNLGRR